MNPEVLALIARLDDEFMTFQHQLECIHGNAIPASIQTSLSALRQIVEQVELLLSGPDKAANQ